MRAMCFRRDADPFIRDLNNDRPASGWYRVDTCIALSGCRVPGRSSAPIDDHLFEPLKIAEHRRNIAGIMRRITTG